SSRSALAPDRWPWAFSVGHQDVAGAPHRLQVSRRLLVPLDLSAQTRHLHVDAALVADLGTDTGEFLSTDRHARIARKGLQQLPFGRRQANEHLAPTQFPPLQFEGELAEENPLCVGLRRSLGRAAED